MASARRIQRVLAHVEGAAATPCLTANATAAGQSNDELRLNGWGYADTSFVLDESTGNFALSGTRYPLGGQILPNFPEYIKTAFSIDTNQKSPPQPIERCEVAPPIRNEGFIAAMQRLGVKTSFEPLVRLHHGHGQTCQEVFALRFGKFDRLPDIVAWPADHAQVEQIVRAASECNVCIIPFGGGTTVSQSLTCPADEVRMIVSLDMKLMNRIKWIDRGSMTICVEAGMIGAELERQLGAEKLTMGHEPDSIEFSSVGGWVATRASGMKKNIYGNIEDILLSVKLVTPAGTLEKGCSAPRISTGPDVNHFVLGSEGILGVITEAVFRIRPAPHAKVFESIAFPNFEAGVACLREIALKRAQPASIRLMDPVQFQFGQSLKGAPSALQKVMDAIKKFYVTQYHGFEPLEICAATLLFEGSDEEVARQQKVIFEIAKKYRGLRAGPENGSRGYLLTFVIAYLRDLGFEYHFLAESFETAVAWPEVGPMCAAVKQRVHDSCKAHGVVAVPFVSCRVTQLYDSGACVYFYFGFIAQNLDDPVGKFSAVEHDAREEIMKFGGSLSHHHGVGKIRKEWITSANGAVGIEALRAIKQKLDPQNIFGAQNLLP